jgi:hypothetical protein
MKTTETIKVFKQDGEHAFCITQDHLDGIKSTDKEKREAKKEGMDEYFKLYDDDDILYYSGYYNMEVIDEEFDILDWAMADSGCTRIDLRNAQGQMETL